MTPLLALAACATDGTPPSDPCRDGFSLAPDGHCYPPLSSELTPSPTDLILLNDCVRAEPGTGLDLFGGCIEGACAFDTFAQIEAALGGGARCVLISGGNTWSCQWPQSISAWFPSAPADSGEPGDNVQSEFIRALVDYAGSDPHGLSLGISMSCFVEELGPPSTAIYVDDVGPLVPSQLDWTQYGVEIEDEERITDGNSFPDDHVDEITLFGPP